MILSLYNDWKLQLQLQCQKNYENLIKNVAANIHLFLCTWVYLMDLRSHSITLFQRNSFYLSTPSLFSKSLSAEMYVCAICSVSNLLSLWSASRLGITCLNLSNASFNPFIRRLSLAFAASLLLLITDGDGGPSLLPTFFLPSFLHNGSDFKHWKLQDHLV